MQSDNVAGAYRRIDRYWNTVRPRNLISDRARARYAEKPEAGNRSAG
jgi:hypothetical protein